MQGQMLPNQFQPQLMNHQMFPQQQPSTNENARPAGIRATSADDDDEQSEAPKWPNPDTENSCLSTEVPVKGRKRKRN